MNSVFDFVSQHQVVTTGAAVAVLDFLFAINKNLEANGLLHGAYLFLTGGKEPPQD